MLGSSLMKAAMSAAFVGLLLTMLRHASPRAAGLAAAVPINSMPALFWLSVDHGGAYAATAALGALWGTGLAAALGLAVARMTRICNVGLGALLATLSVSALAVAICNVPSALTLVTGLAMAAVLIGQSRHSAVAGRPRRQPARSGGLLLSIAVAGLMSLVITELSRLAGPQFLGLIAAIPVIGIATAVSGYRQGGAPVMLGVVDGYLAGMLAKAAFLGAIFFAWRAGVDGWAWVMALTSAGLALQAQHSLPAIRDGVTAFGARRRGVPATAAGVGSRRITADNGSERLYDEIA